MKAGLILCLVALTPLKGQGLEIAEVQLAGPETISSGASADFDVTVKGTTDETGNFEFMLQLVESREGVSRFIEFGTRSGYVADGEQPFSDYSTMPLQCTRKGTVRGTLLDTKTECTDVVVRVNNGASSLESGKHRVCCTKDSSSGGEPHFTTFHGDFFDYHGVCDLVLASSPSFASGRGLDIHIRTKEYEQAFSVISNAALRIGNDVLEVTKDGDYYVNGELNPQLPFSLAGLYAVTRRINTESSGFDPSVSHGFSKAELSDSVLFTVDIGGGEYIEIQAWKEMLWINTRGSHKNFHDSVGLMGQWGQEGKFARDGIREITDPDEFANEWQVLETEPKLFQTATEPQHPAACIPPSPIVPRRRLGEEEHAKTVCAGVQGREHNFCVFDVLATGDEEMALIYLSK